MSFRFDISRCPACRAVAEGAVSRLYALDVLSADEDGTYCYSGSVEISWESQVTLPAEDQSTMRLGCRDGHVWDTGFEEIDDLDLAVTRGPGTGAPAIQDPNS